MKEKDGITKRETALFAELVIVGIFLSNWPDRSHQWLFSNLAVKIKLFFKIELVRSWQLCCLNR